MLFKVLFFEFKSIFFSMTTQHRVKNQKIHDKLYFIKLTVNSGLKLALPHF